MKLINNTLNFPKYLIKKFEKTSNLEDAVKVYDKYVAESNVWYHLRWSFINNKFELFGFNYGCVIFEM